MIEKLPHHERFKDYSEAEIIEIKRKVCMDHKCPYLSNFRLTSLINKDNPTSKSCNYIAITGHMRGCMPDECTHYLDQNVKKRISPMTGNYQI